MLLTCYSLVAPFCLPLSAQPSFAIELQAVGAVQKWRDLIGPTDPAKAKVEAPDSLRCAIQLILWSPIAHWSAQFFSLWAHHLLRFCSHFARARHGTDVTYNGFHGSESVDAAHREMRLVFEN